MFFFFPFGGGGGFFTLIFVIFLFRMIVRSLKGSSSHTQYHYYEFNPNQEYQQHQGYQQQRQEVPRSNQKAYSALGLTSSATDEEVKKAYRKLILEFHPDKIAAKGLGNEFTDFATKRFREVQEAYEQICKERNIK